MCDVCEGPIGYGALLQVCVPLGHSSSAPKVPALLKVHTHRAVPPSFLTAPPPLSMTSVTFRLMRSSVNPRLGVCERMCVSERDRSQVRVRGRAVDEPPTQCQRPDRQRQPQKLPEA